MNLQNQFSEQELEEQMKLHNEQDNVIEDLLPEDATSKEKQRDIEENLSLDDVNKKNKQLLIDWKEKYGKIYLSVYDDLEFVWRKIKRKEYTELMESSPEEEADVVEIRQKQVIEICLLSPESGSYLDDLLENYPGILTSLSGEILKKSGFTKPLTIEL